MSERLLASGQWLGQENRVMRVFIRRGRWVMRDSTGEEYAERDFPDGFVTWDVAPWPYNNAGPGEQSSWAVHGDET